MAPEQVFLDFLKIFVIGFSWKESNMKTKIVIDISPPIPYSQDSNRRHPPPINFEKNFHPGHCYSKPPTY